MIDIDVIFYALMIAGASAMVVAIVVFFLGRGTERMIDRHRVRMAEIESKNASLLITLANLEFCMASIKKYTGSATDNKEQ